MPCWRTNETASLAGRISLHPDGNRLVWIDVKSGVEKQLATLDPPPDSILAGHISLHPDGNRLAVSFVRQHRKIYMLEGLDESTSWFDRLMRRFKRA